MRFFRTLPMIATLLLAVSGVAGAGEAVRVPLEVFASQADVAAYPIEIGVPFAPGALKDPAHLRLLGPDGTEVPCQVEGLSCYADGSLRAVLLVFLSPVSKDKTRQYAVEFGAGVARKAAPASPVKVSGGGPVSVDTGALQFQVGAGGTLLSADTASGKPVLPGGIEQFIQEVGQANQVAATQAEAKVEESGPVRAVILLKGRFGSGADAHSWQVRVHAYAGTSLVRIQHTVLGLDGKRPLELAGWGLRIPAGTKKSWCGLDGAARELALSAGEGLFQDGTFEFAMGSLSEEEGRARLKQRKPFAPGELPGWHYRMSCAIGTKEPVAGKADGWLATELANGRLELCVRDFWQQCPKEWAGGKDDITLWLHSPKGKPFLAKAGTAKTHEILLNLAASGNDAASAQALNAVFQDWPHARVSPEHACATGLYGPLLARSDPFTAPYNSIADVCLAFVTQTAGLVTNRASWYLYGNADFGDIGKAVFSYNLPAEQPRGFSLEYMRGGDREWMRLAARSARHYADVDICHAATGESEPGRPWTVGKPSESRKPWPETVFGKMVSQDVFALSPGKLPDFQAKTAQVAEGFAAVKVPVEVHQNRPSLGDEYSCHTGGLLYYYLFSGDRRAREVLEEEASWVLKAIEAGRGAKGEQKYLSFRLACLLDAHEATGDARLLKGAALLMQDLVALWKTPNVRVDISGRWIMSSTRLTGAAFRFIELNVPEANLGLDNAVIRKTLADANAAMILAWGTIGGCTPSYIHPWARAEALGLWPEDTRKVFEEKVLIAISAGRKPSMTVSGWPAPNVVKKGTAPVRDFTLQYKLPFLFYKVRGSGGAFAPFDAEAMAQTCVGGSDLGPFLCHLQELGITQGMLDYPHFLEAWKNYHEKYLKPRMNAEGVLEFAASP